jgi:hypothetical protein
VCHEKKNKFLTLVVVASLSKDIIKADTDAFLLVAIIVNQLTWWKRDWCSS